MEHEEFARRAKSAIAAKSDGRPDDAAAEMRALLRDLEPAAKAGVNEWHQQQALGLLIDALDAAGRQEECRSAWEELIELTQQTGTYWEQALTSARDQFALWGREHPPRSGGDLPPRPAVRSAVVQPAVGQPADLVFLNVDLDIESADDLTVLASAFAPLAYALERPTGRASFELNDPEMSKDPESVILEFVRRVNDLPRSAREVWDRASRRVFDIGVQSGRRPSQLTHRVSSHTLRAVADVGAAIAVTVYAVMPDDETRQVG